MKIFLDTADFNEIEQVKHVIDGLTTNPSLMNKAVESLRGKGENINLEDYIRKILKAVKGPVSLEVNSAKYEAIVEEAKLLHNKYNKVNRNVVIKIPVSTFTGEDSATQFESLMAIRKLKGKIPTNATLVMSVSQAVLAAKAGATYVSPFVGRIDDGLKKKIGIPPDRDGYLDAELLEDIAEELVEKSINHKTTSIGSVYGVAERKHNKFHDDGIYSGVDLTEKIISVYDNYGFKTKIIAASIRNKRQVEELAVAGVDIVTVPFSVLLEMEAHYKTKEGVKKFREDAKGLKY